MCVCGGGRRYQDRALNHPKYRKSDKSEGWVLWNLLRDTNSLKHLQSKVIVLSLFAKPILNYLGLGLLIYYLGTLGVYFVTYCHYCLSSEILLALPSVQALTEIWVSKSDYCGLWIKITTGFLFVSGVCVQIQGPGRTWSGFSCGLLVRVRSAGAALLM